MLICPYCGNEKQDWQLGCCGENHWEEVDDSDENLDDQSMLRAATKGEGNGIA